MLHCAALAGNQVDCVSEQLDLPILIAGQSKQILYANQAARLLFDLDGSAPEQAPAMLKHLVSLVEGDFTLPLAAPDGERYYRARILQKFDADEAASTRLISFHDQTEQVHLIRKLIESDDRLQAVGQATSDLMLIIDDQQHIVFANAAIERILGWAPQDVLGAALPDILGTSLEERLVARLIAPERVGNTEHALTRFDLSLTHRDGKPIDLELSLNHFRAEHGSKTMLILHDVTDRLSRQRQLEEAEARWHFALEGNGDGVWDWDISNGKIAFSSRFKSMLGYADDEFPDDYDDWEEHIHPDDLPRTRAQLQAYLEGRREQYACEFRMRTRLGDYLWILDRGLIVARDADGKPLRMVGTQRDIDDSVRTTESLRQQLVETLELNQKLEETQVQLVQTEKLAVIGQLAAGVAHEMNTPLGYVSSNLNTLESYARDLLKLVHVFRTNLEQAPAADAGLSEAKALCEQTDLPFIEDDLPSLLTETREGLDRVLRIVRDLRDFSRPGEQQWQSVDLHNGLDSTLNILHNQLKHSITIVRDYGDLPLVWCVPSQINQVFLNLLNNARQAIRERGTITIRTRHEAACAIVEIEDDGFGMTEEQLRRIFEPFFTTKPTGEGTGLGLSLSLDIIQRHGGSLTADSDLGTGSTFTVSLPIRAKHDASPDTHPTGGDQAQGST